MLQKIRTFALPIVTVVLTLLSSLFWVALRVNYSGISKFLGADTNPSFLVMNLPIMICVLAWVGFGLSVIGLILWPKRKVPTIAGLIIGCIVTVGAIVVVLFGAKDYLRFIMVHFWESFWITVSLLLFALVLFFPVKNSKRTVPAKAVLLAALVLVAVILGYQLRPCDFTYGPVVYAVEDDYQIVFSTSDSAAAWVEIDGAEYYDLFAGSMKSNDRVHKITVPQSVLDRSGSYTICAQQMIYRGPFGGYKGDTISQRYVFRPVDTSDGLNYYALSDVHEAVDAAIAATNYDFDTQLDFLVLLGDIVSMVESEADAQMANELAYGITKGQIPVIYARGNHEIKGEYGEDFYKYVGSKDGSYYYTVTFGTDVLAVVLDLGEDHEDDWWEYYGTAKFDLYRQAQTEMLEELLEDGDYANYRYRMALCHIPITYVDGDGRFGGFRQEWTRLLNEMDMDISLSGHEHRLLQFIPGMVPANTPLTYSAGYAAGGKTQEGGIMTDANFPAILVGRRSLNQQGGTQNDGNDQYVGFHVQVDFATGDQSCCYTNSRGQIMEGFYSFGAGDPFRQFSLEMKRAQ